jgi:hypothetical protein
MSRSISREAVSGWKGRRRNYKCHSCGDRFRVDSTLPIPESLRLCPDCCPSEAWLIDLQQNAPGLVLGGRRLMPGRGFEA